MQAEVRSLTADILRLEEIRSTFARYCSELQTSRPSWNRKTDARITAFAGCGNTLTNIHLGTVLMKTSLRNDTWWSAVFPKAGHPTLRTRLAQEFDMFLKMGLAHFLFSCVESSYRLFLKALDTKACSGGTGSFESVYVCLLTRLDLDAKWVDFLDFWRLIRNSIHNNGIYLPSSGKDREIDFEGTTHSFRVGQRVDCATWRNLLRIAERTPDMLMDLVTSDHLSAVPSIEDPFAGPRPWLADVSSLLAQPKDNPPPRVS